MQFPVYERLKATARVRRGGGRETAVDLILASATSKIVGSSVTYPHEVLRARMQVRLAKEVRPIVRMTLSLFAIRGITNLDTKILFLRQPDLAWAEGTRHVQIP